MGQVAQTQHVLYKSKKKAQLADYFLTQFFLKVAHK